MRVRYDGTVYEIRAGDLTALDTLALRRETGFTFGRLMNLDPDDFDIDVVAAIVWLCRRQAGENTLRYAAVAADISYVGVLDSFDVVDDEDEGDAEGESQPADV